jgi:hypothetical protein
MLAGGGFWTDSIGAVKAAPSGWTTDSSCDASVAGAAGDNVDRWITNTDVSWDTSGSAHSWKVLVSSDFFGVGQPLYVLFDCSEASSATRNGTIGVWLAQSSFTGGTTTNRPTSVDEHQILAEDGTDTTASWQGVDSSGILAKVLHMEVEENGSIFRVQICNGGFCEAYWDLFLVTDPPAGWSRPVVMSIMSSDVATDNNTWAVLHNANAAYLGFDSILGPFVSFASMSGWSSSERPIVDLPGNSFDSTFVPGPIILVGSGVVLDGTLTVIPDTWWGSNVNSTGDHASDDAGNLRQFVQMGEFAIEWNRTVSLVS